MASGPAATKMIASINIITLLKWMGGGGGGGGGGGAQGGGGGERERERWQKEKN